MGKIERKPVIVVEVEQDFKDKVAAIAKRKGIKTAVYVRFLLYEMVEREAA